MNNSSDNNTLKHTSNWFRKFLTGLALLCLLACGRPDDEVVPSARPISCDYQSLLSAFGWNASFVDQLLTCLRPSGGRTDESALQQTQAALDRFGKDSLQAALDLLRSESTDPQAPGLPYLRALSTLLDRASYDFNEQLLLAATFDADTLQALLLELRPAVFVDILQTWQKEGSLRTNLLYALDFLEALPPSTLSALVRKLLTQPDLKASLSRLSQEWLQEPAIVEAWSGLFGTEAAPMRARDCWFQSEVSASCEDPTQQSHPWAAFAAYWNQLDAASRERSITNLALLLQEWLSQDDRDIAYQLDRGLQIIRSYSLGQSSVSDDLLAWMRPLMSSQLDSFKPFIDGLRAIRRNPLYFDVIQEKVAISAVKQQIKQRLSAEVGTTPRQVAGCLQELPSLDQKLPPDKLWRHWQTWNQPSASCQGMRPLQALMLETLGLSCDQDCQTSFANLYKLPLSDYSDLASKPSEFSLLKQSFIAWASERLRQRLATSPAYLYGLGLANEAIDTTSQGLLLSKINSHEFHSVADIQSFDEELQLSRTWRGRLQPNFLQQWLVLQLDELQVIQQQISSFLPPEVTSPLDQTWSRRQADSDLAWASLLGLFPGSQQSLWLAATIEENSALTGIDLEANPSLQRFLFSLSSPLALYRNRQASFKAEPLSLNIAWRGQIRNYERFNPQGLRLTSQRQSSMAELVVGSELSESLYLPHRWLDTMAIAEPALASLYGQTQLWQSRDNLADSFLAKPEQWLKNWSTRKPSLQTASPEAMQFFLGRDLRADELHLIWWFTLQNFAEDAPLVIEDAVIAEGSGRDRINSQRVARAFTGALAFANQDDAWLAQLAHQSSYLKKAAAASSFAEFLANLTPTEKQMRAYYQLLRNEARRFQPENIESPLLSELSDVEMLFGSLNLNGVIYRSRSEALLSPLVAFEPVCPTFSQDDSQRQSEACPVSFADYASWSAWFQKQVSLKYCPMWQALEGHHQLIQQLFRWPETKGLAELDITCQSESQARAEESLSVARFSAQLLLELQDLGRPTQIHPEILALQQHLARAQWLSRAASKASAELADLWQGPSYAAGSTKRAAMLQEDFYRAYSTSRTDQFELSLLELKQVLGSRQILTALLKFLDDSGGLDRLEGFIDDSLAEFELAFLSDANLLEFAFVWSKKVLTSAAHRQVVHELLSDLDQASSGILLSYTLPQALRAGVLPNLQTSATIEEMDASAYRWMFSTLAPKRWQAVSDLVGLAQHKLESVIDVLNLSLRQYQGSEQFSADILNFLAFLGQQIDYLQDQKQFDSRLSMLLRSAFSPHFASDLSQLSKQLLKTERLDILNRRYPALLSESRPIIEATLDQLPRLVSSALSSSNLPPTSDVTEALASLPRALSAGSGDLLFEVLQDRRLGFWDGSIWKDLVRNQEHFRKVEMLLQGSDRLRADEILSVIDEFDEIALAGNRWLSFINRELVWSNQQALTVDYAYALASVDRCLNEDNRWLFTQELIRTWINETPEQARRQP